jgi:hypothetical protein
MDLMYYDRALARSLQPARHRPDGSMMKHLSSDDPAGCSMRLRSGTMEALSTTFLGVRFRCYRPEAMESAACYLQGQTLSLAKVAKEALPKTWPTRWGCRNTQISAVQAILPTIPFVLMICASHLPTSPSTGVMDPRPTQIICAHHCLLWRRYRSVCLSAAVTLEASPSS